MKRTLAFGLVVFAFLATGRPKSAEAAAMCADYGQACNPNLGPSACCNPMLICGTLSEPGVFRCEAQDR